MARRLNGSSDFIVFTLPSTLQSVTAGSTTIVCVANFADGTDGAMVHARTSGGTNSWWMETASNVWNYGQGVAARGVGGQTNGSWAAYIGRKTTGGANAPRGRKIVYGGSTTDTTAGSALADGTAPGAGGILQVGRWGTASEYLAADVAAVAVFTSDLSDATTATFTTWANILAAGPAWAVHFDQASPTDAITDATGNGGNSSSITGTTIVSNPSGFFASGVTPSGVAVSISPGSPSTSIPSSAPSGLAVAVALGSPSTSIPGVTPTGIAVTVSVGSPAVSLRSAAPSGIAVPISLGSPASTAGVGPTGLAVAVAPGSPATAIPGVMPSGIALGVALGSPSAALARSAAPSGIAVALALGSPAVGGGRVLVVRPDAGTVTRPDNGLVVRP